MIPVINKLLFIKIYLFSCTRIDQKIQNTEEIPLHNTESTDSPCFVVLQERSVSNLNTMSHFFTSMVLLYKTYVKSFGFLIL